ncbi:unnamed protein product [Microthlaspi erraticum]|uniref:Bifunctional inhibitor/plant lipid transfer protein/seed storage helical domain-containing protein n=1 Tax=Microthlaspi erraticum TaxID=1685480 RepID=A0A6D2L0N7_9BRAS|nr:unnamed protein product [Microthlaspi erraticum]
MAYLNKAKGLAVAVTTVLFLAVAIAPQWTSAQPPPMPEFDSICAISIPEIVKHCYATISAVPSEECCKDLKTASKREVTCLCDNFFTHPIYSNITKVYFSQVNTACGVLDKYACNGANGGAMNKITTSVALFGLVASLFF